MVLISVTSFEQVAVPKTRATASASRISSETIVYGTDSRNPTSQVLA